MLIYGQLTYYRGLERLGHFRMISDLAGLNHHSDHICQLAADNAHVTVGSDLDGGVGREETFSDIDTVADPQNLNGLLFKRGFGEADIAAILHDNWLRILRQVWQR